MADFKLVDLDCPSVLLGSTMRTTGIGYLHGFETKMLTQSKVVINFSILCFEVSYKITKRSPFFLLSLHKALLDGLELALVRSLGLSGLGRVERGSELSELLELLTNTRGIHVELR